jgi:chemosensory pili system protein ChpA (sensor histidine kinase/response regulator)
MIQPRLHTPQETEFVMIVDDDEGVSTLLQRLLSQEGYGTMLARNGRAALDILQRGGIVPSVILLDLMMPRMGGLEFVERLERDDTFCDIPVILMSGHAALAAGNKVRNLNLLPKPFRTDEVLRLVRTVARRTSSRWVTSVVDQTQIADQR